MGKRSRNMKNRLLVSVLSLAMLLTGVTMPTGTKKAKAAEEIELDVLSGGKSGTNVSLAENPAPEANDYIHDVLFTIPDQAKAKGSVTSFEVKVSVTGAPTGESSIVLYAQPESWTWNTSDYQELKTGEITLKYDFAGMNWGNSSTLGKIALRFANDSAGSVSYNITSAKLITGGSSSSAGGGSTGKDQTTWDVEDENLKLSYTAEDLWDAYTEYNFTVINNGSSTVSGNLVVTFDKVRTEHWWTDKYSISLIDGGKAVQVSNLSIPAGSSEGPVQIQLEPLGATITSVTFAGKTIGAESSSSGGVINPDLELEYNFAKALQYSLYLYDANMCGQDVADKTAFTWRGNCHIEDTKMTYNGRTVNVSGGYHDAGDHAKFNLPQAYSASTLGIGYYEFKDAFTELGQDEHMKIIMDRFVEYFKNCTIMDSSGSKVEAYCYQLGAEYPDHAYWGAPEKQTEVQGSRDAYFTSSSNPCTDTVGETAAALAIYAVNYKEADPTAADEALKYARALFDYAESGNKGITFVSNIYESKDWHDDMALASIWLHKATGEAYYKSKYNEYVVSCKTDWVMCWDDVSAAAYLYGGQYDNTRATIQGQMSKKSPQNFVYVDGSWGSARYNTALQLMGLSVDKESGQEDYQEWALGQMTYLMGNNTSKRNFIVGYNENSPKCIHHRAASGYNVLNDETAKIPLAHTIYGALAGGPNANDVYTDNAQAYQYSEVAIDYNAGFVGALAGLYLQQKDGQFSDQQYLETLDEMDEVSKWYGDPDKASPPDGTPKPAGTKNPPTTTEPAGTTNPPATTDPVGTTNPPEITNPSETTNPPTPTATTPGEIQGSAAPTPTASSETQEPTPTPTTPGEIQGPSTPTPGETQRPTPTATTPGEIQGPSTPTPGETQKPTPTATTPGEIQGPSTPTPGETQKPTPTATTPGEIQGPTPTPTMPGEIQGPTPTPTIPGEIQGPTPTPTAPGEIQTPTPTDPVGTTPPPDASDDPHASQNPQASGLPGAGTVEGVITDLNTAISSGWANVDASLAEQTILSQKTDKDISGSVFGVLQLKAAKTTKKSVKLKWKKVSGASKYVVYGNRCGNSNTLQKLATVPGTGWTHSGLKKGTYYKYMVMACQTINGVDVSLSISKTVHATTLGGKKGNAKKVTVKKASATIKKGKTFKIKKAKQIPLKKKNKIANHRKISYESSKKAIATVSSSGKIKAKKKGKCTIYVYAQNGICKQVKVTVK